MNSPFCKMLEGAIIYLLKISTSSSPHSWERYAMFLFNLCYNTVKSWVISTG